MSECNQKMIMGVIIGFLGGFLIFSALSNLSISVRNGNSNDESWEVERDERGLAKSVSVHRRVS